jgi:hypothetical protein
MKLVPHCVLLRTHDGRWCNGRWCRMVPTADWQFNAGCAVRSLQLTATSCSLQHAQLYSCTHGRVLYIVLYIRIIQTFYTHSSILLTGLFNCKVCFQAIICVCDRKAFSHLFAIVSKYQFSSKFWLEFGQYMVVDIEVPLRKETLHEDSHVLLSLSLLQWVGINIKKMCLDLDHFHHWFKAHLRLFHRNKGFIITRYALKLSKQFGMQHGMLQCVWKRSSHTSMPGKYIIKVHLFKYIQI